MAGKKANGVASLGNREIPVAKRTKTVACRRCHTRKIKCSGGTPGIACVKSRHDNECSYFVVDRPVKVGRRFLQQVLAENEQLKQNTPPARAPSSNDTGDIPRASPGPLDNEETVRNPLMEDRAWFIPNEFANPPIYVGEAACTAFATRFRQTLAGSQTSTFHIPRIHYIRDDDLLSISTSQVPWPTRTHAQLLVKVALVNINRSFHVVVAKPTLSKLDEVYRDKAFTDPVTTCKFFALFALGEVYSRRSGSSLAGEFPGLSYFMRASSMIQILPERANLEQIEILILLSFFSHNLNRKNSAYSWICSALCLAVTIGLHHNLPHTMEIDPVAREHRVRIWWTIYTCDRMWGSKMGHPIMIQDRDISVNMPSMSGLNEEESEQFPVPDCIISSIKLAQIASSIITDIYSRGHSPPPFVQSVQKILRQLNQWIADLPESIRLVKSGGSTPRHIVSLHLSFNQCVILATRPVLLHEFAKSRNSRPAERSPFPNNNKAVTSILAEACLHAARHSSDLLTEVWIEGTLSTLGYFDAQYLFSSATVLSISGVSDNSHKDNDRVESAAQLLRTMAESGNLSATEFCGHLDQVMLVTEQSRSSATAANNIEAEPVGDVTENFGSMMNSLTTEMALLEPPMQNFLTQADFEMDFPNPVDGMNGTSLLYCWPAEM